MSFDTYNVGDYVRRESPAGKPIAALYVTEPSGRTLIGNVQVVSISQRFWHMIASIPGSWYLIWRCADGADVTDEFEVIDDRVPVKSFPYLNDSNLTLVPLNTDHLELLRAWRNAAKEWFFTQAEISEEQQIKWYYGTYVHDMTDFLWIVHLDGLPVGTGSLTHIDLDKREGEWSRLIIGNDSARGQGVAGRICRIIRDYGLDELNLNRIYGSLFTANLVTMHIDNAAGYMPYKVEGDVTFVELWRKDHRHE